MSEQAQAPSPLIPIPRAPAPDIPPAVARHEFEITIDGKRVAVPEGATILDAARKLGIETPTLCFLETLTPVMFAGCASWNSKDRGRWCPLAREKSKPAW